MAQHDIEANLPAHRVLNTDLSVVVKSDGRRLGELRISKGSIDWRPSKHQGIVKMRWERFADFMERYQAGELR
jgi:hypothetical protein